jgi:hypothetical protein
VEGDPVGRPGGVSGGAGREGKGEKREGKSTSIVFDTHVHFHIDQVGRDVYWLLSVYKDGLVRGRVIGWARGYLEHVLLMVFDFWHLEIYTKTTFVLEMLILEETSRWSL